MLSEKRCDVGAVVINYGEGPPSGPPLALFHGGASRWQGLLPLIAALVEGWHVFAPDFRGHGRSSWVPGHYRLTDYTADSRAFLEHQVAQPAVLVGHSLGGLVALLVAARAPQLVRGVVCVETPFSLPHLCEHIARTADEAVRRNRASDHPHDPDIHAALSMRFENTFTAWAPGIVLPEVTCPVLLLQADPACGGMVTDAEVEAALPLLARVRHVRVAGTAHNSLLEELPALRALTEFLGTLQNPSRGTMPTPSSSIG